jgi:hypothetical protein
MPRKAHLLVQSFAGVSSSCRWSASFVMPSDFDNIRSMPMAVPSDLETSSVCIEKRIMRGITRLRITAASAPVIIGMDRSSKIKSD